MEFGKEKYNEGSEEGEERRRYRDGETETGIFTFCSCSRSEGQTPVWSKKKKLKGKLKEMYVCRPYICGMWYLVCSIWYVCPSNKRCKVFLYPCSQYHTCRHIQERKENRCEGGSEQTGREKCGMRLASSQVFALNSYKEPRQLTTNILSITTERST